MKSPKEYHEYIDRYRAGEISEPDFKQRLESNAELKHEFELQKRDLQIIRSAAKEQLKKKALTALENYEKKSVKVFPLKIVMQIAAAFVLLAAAIFLIQNIGQPKSEAELFANYFELPASEGERGSNSSSEIWNESMMAYSNQDFEKTIELLSPLVNDVNFQYSDRGNLYLGLSYLMQNENQKAIDVFDSISSQSSYFQKAEWYKALSFLKMNNKEEAKNTMQKIANQPRHFKNKEAKIILEDL